MIRKYFDILQDYYKSVSIFSLLLKRTQIMDGITKNLIVKKEAGIGSIQFNNQERRNAMTFGMWKDLPVVLEDFSSDPAIRVVTLSGAGGKAFCAGADISEFEQNRSSKDTIALYDSAVDFANDTLSQFSKPTIAKIEGFCVGGGLGIALCCDLRLCNDQAVFSVPASKLGLGYKAKGLKRLVDLVGPSMAKEIFFTARLFTCQEAVTMGLINRILPKSILSQYVDNYVKTIAENAPLTIHAAKVVIDQIKKPSNQYDHELCESVVEKCFESNDYKEGRLAFMEKRKPEFMGN